MELENLLKTINTLYTEKLSISEHVPELIPELISEPIPSIPENNITTSHISGSYQLPPTAIFVCKMTVYQRVITTWILSEDCNEDNVISYCQENNLKVIKDSPQHLKVTCTVNQINNLFQTTLNIYTDNIHAAHQYYAPKNDPIIPHELENKVLNIIGLTNR